MEKRKLQSGIACFHSFIAEKAENQSAQGIQTRKPIKQFSSMTNPALQPSGVFFGLDNIRYL